MPDVCSLDSVESSYGSVRGAWQWVSDWQRAWRLAVGERLALFGVHTSLTANLTVKCSQFSSSLLATAACFGLVFVMLFSNPRLGRASGLFFL